MSWWRIQKGKGREYWLISSEVTLMFWIVLTLAAVFAAIIGYNILPE